MTTPSARLTADEAAQLWRGWTERGDRGARDRLVLAFAPMVRFLAVRKLRELPGHCELDDLCSAGLVALLECVDRFDPVRGPFERYAWTRISGALVDELRRLDWASRSVRREGRRIEQARDVLVARGGAQPTKRQLAGELGLAEDDLRDRLDDLARADVASLSAPIRHSDGRDAELVDLQVEPIGRHEPELATLRRERSHAFRAAVESLTEQERRAVVIVHVQGLGGGVASEQLGVSQSRVSQLLGAARIKLGLRLAAYDAVAA